MLSMWVLLADAVPSGIGPQDYAIIVALVAALGALVRLVDYLVRKVVEKRANGNGYHKHKRSEDTREIAV